MSIRFRVEYAYCERIAIAGSIRRCKAEVKDLELVAIPKWEMRPDPENLFGEDIAINPLHQWATSTRRPLQWIKPGTSELLPWKVEAEGRYWRGLLGKPYTEAPLKLDLFLASERNWGAIYLIRTGSAEFSHAVATHAKKIGRRFKNGSLTIAGIAVATPEEDDVFRLLGLAAIEPERRTGFASLRRLNG